MQYRNNKKGEPISILGYGCMRFSKNGAKIDLDKTEKELRYAIDHGLNYLDTAYIYPGSEVAVGELVKRIGCRDKIQIATKLPHYLIKSLDGIEKIFQEELKRLQTDYVDYYLMHMLSEVGTWNSLIEMGILGWIEEKKKSGQIRNIGFSYHGKTEPFIQLIDAYDWDFCQIQYNYMDENTQAGKKGLQYAASKGIPVIIMEPLRGGRLVDKLPQGAKNLIEASDLNTTAAKLALRWLYNQPEVTCVLSGMNSLEMVTENVSIAEESVAGSLTPEETALIENIKKEIQKSVKVGCTGCGYCMPCPKGVDIPTAFSCYNAAFSDGKASAQGDYMRLTALRKNQAAASQCIKCGKCEKHCPQGLPIRDKLDEAKRVLENPVYKIVKWAVNAFHLYK